MKKILLFSTALLLNYCLNAQDVFKVGTPVNDEIGVWTGDGTIEGDSNFRWNGTTMYIDSATKNTYLSSGQLYMENSGGNSSLVLSLNSLKFTNELAPVTGNTGIEYGINGISYYNTLNPPDEETYNFYKLIYPTNAYATVNFPSASGTIALKSDILNAFTAPIGTTYLGENTIAAGNYNSFFGYATGENSVENNNSFFGAYAGRSNTIGKSNVFIGMNAGRENIEGINNSFLGTDAGRQNQGNGNTSLGYKAGNSTSGDYNVNLGYAAGFDALTGSKNVYLGFYSGEKNNGSRNVFLGNESGRNSTGSNKLYIENSASTTPLIWGDFSADIVNINGNLGIGTTTPSAKLEILKNADLSTDITLLDSGLIIRADNGGNDASLRFGVDNTNLKAVMQTQQTTTGTKFDILINPFGGKVGIGTTEPAYKLDIHGISPLAVNKFAIANVIHNIDPDTGSIQSGVIQLGDVDGNAAELALFDDHSLEVVRISDGKVGIGTTTPDEKLTVKGKIHTEEVRVDLTVPGPDYVFEKYYNGESKLNPSYNMPTLQEIEIYTKANHHLPELPSAQEMQDHGIQLKEMNLKLLQKIEELTLYTIAQEKKLEQQQALLELQQKDNKNLNKRLENLETMVSRIQR